MSIGRLGPRRDDVRLVAGIEHGRVRGVANGRADHAGDRCRAWAAPGRDRPGRSPSPVISAMLSRKRRTVSVITIGNSWLPIRDTAAASRVTDVVVVRSSIRARAGPSATSRSQAMPFSAVWIGYRRRSSPSGDAEAADLADRLGAVGEQVRVVLDQPVGALAAAGLLVGDERQHDVARRPAVRFAPSRARRRGPSRPCPSCRPRRGPTRSRRGPRRRTGRRSTRTHRPGRRRDGRGSAAAAGCCRRRRCGRSSDARPGSDSRIWLSMPTSSSFCGDPLGRRPLDVRRVGRVDADQVAEQVDDRVSGGGRRRCRHATFLPPRSRRAGVSAGASCRGGHRRTPARSPPARTRRPARRAAGCR